MILHCVFVRFKAALQGPDKQAIYDAIVALKPLVPGMLDVTFGPNVSPESLNGGFRDGFIVTFDDADARDAYLAHPEHAEIGSRLVASTDGGVAGLLVFDMEA